jgi:hypothetical protein
MNAKGNKMATIQIAHLEKDLPMEVQFIEVPADAGEPASVELVSVKLFGHDIPVSKELAEAIRDELLETV